MNPELKLAFQQKVYELHINSSMGVDEKNISKIDLICEQLNEYSRQLYYEVYPPRPPRDDMSPNALEIVEIDLPENDVAEATQELRSKLKPHRPEVKTNNDGISLKSISHPHNSK